MWRGGLGLASLYMTLFFGCYWRAGIIALVCYVLASAMFVKATCPLRTPQLIGAPALQDPT